MTNDESMTNDERRKNDETRIILRRFCETPRHLTQRPYNLVIRNSLDIRHSCFVIDSERLLAQLSEINVSFAARVTSHGDNSLPLWDSDVNLVGDIESYQ